MRSLVPAAPQSCKQTGLWHAASDCNTTTLQNCQDLPLQNGTRNVAMGYAAKLRSWLYMLAEKPKGAICMSGHKLSRATASPDARCAQNGNWQHTPSAAAVLGTWLQSPPPATCTAAALWYNTYTRVPQNFETPWINHICVLKTDLPKLGSCRKCSRPPPAPPEERLCTGPCKAALQISVCCCGASETSRPAAGHACWLSSSSSCSQDMM